MEWAVIKGVADYADGTNSSTDEWKRFASFMAASVTAKVLNPIAFKNIPNYEGKNQQLVRARMTPRPTSSFPPPNFLTRSLGKRQKAVALRR